MLTVLPILAIVAVVTFGCAQRINWNDPMAIANKVEIKHDEFKKLTSFDGPNCAADQPDDTLVIRAWKMRNGDMHYQIYVADEYTHEVARGGAGWRFYSSANDSEGNKLETLPISRHLNWCGRYVCSYREILGIQVTRDYLEERKTRGIRFKISGRNGEETFSLPPAYVQAFLSVVN